MLERIDLTGGEIIEFIDGKIKGVVVLILNYNEINGTYNIYNIQENETINNYNLADSYKILTNLNNLFQKQEYTWMGIEYNEYRLLLNLTSLTFEYFNVNESMEWEFLEDNIVHEDNDSISVAFPGFIIKVDLNNLSCQVMDKYGTKFRNYNNYLLGRNGEYLFNDELELKSFY